MVALAAFVLPRDDVPIDGDVVVVLGGGDDERTELGIELTERFGVPLVLSSTARDSAAHLGWTCGRDAICFAPVPGSTAGEARTVAAMAETHGWEHVVATSSFHTSRSRVLFEQCLSEGRVSLLGRPPPDGPQTTPRLVLRESFGVIAGIPSPAPAESSAGITARRRGPLRSGRPSGAPCVPPASTSAPGCGTCCAAR